jgi:hypothetical protein
LKLVHAFAALLLLRCTAIHSGFATIMMTIAAVQLEAL